MTAAAGSPASPASPASPSASAETPVPTSEGDDVWRRPLRRYGFLVLVAAATFALDQLTKQLVKSSMEPGDVIPVIPPVLDLHYITNRGVAFGLFPRFGDVFVPVVLLFITIHLGLHSSPTPRPSCHGAGCPALAP